MTRIEKFIPHVPGLIHYSDPITEQGSSDQAAQLKNMMKQSGGMTGSKDLTPGVFQRMISYGYMPLKDMVTAFNDSRLTPEQEANIEAYTELVKLGLRHSENVIDSWLTGYGATRTDLPSQLKKEFNYELSLWNAREKMARNILEHPPREMKEWMDELSLLSEMLIPAPVNPYKIDLNLDYYVPSEVLLRMRDLGLFRLKIPKEYGGLGLHQQEYDRVLRSMTHTFSGTLGAIVSAHSTLGSKLIVEHGTEAQKNRFLPMFAQGLGLCAFGLTEIGSGTDAMGSAKTVARRSSDGKDWVLNTEDPNSQKMFITNTQRACLMYVMAKVDDGSGELKPTVFMLELPFRLTDKKEDTLRKRDELRAKGLYISNPLELMMIRGSNQAHMEFNNYKIPLVNEHGVEAILGGNEAGLGRAAQAIFGGLEAGRIGFGAYCAEAASNAFKLALDEVVQRRRFPSYGGTLADLPDVKRRLSEMAVRSAMVNAASDMTSRLIDTFSNMNIIAEAAAIKVIAAEAAWDTGRTTARLFGGKGTMRGFPVEMMLRDLWIPLIGEGTHEALKQYMILVSAKPAMREAKTLLGKLSYAPLMLTGDFTLLSTNWIQRATRRLSGTALRLGAFSGKKAALKQHEAIEIADRAIDLYMMTSAQIKLRSDKSLSEAEQIALSRGIQNIKNNNALYAGKLLNFVREPEKYPDYIGDLYIDDARIEVSERKNYFDELVKNISQNP